MGPLLNYQASYSAACVRNMLFIFGVHVSHSRLRSATLFSRAHHGHTLDFCTLKDT